MANSLGSDSASDSGSIRSFTSSSTSDHLSFSALQLSSKSFNDQISLLALTWILLVYRGSADGQDGFFTYGFSSSNLAHSKSFEDSGHVSDIVRSTSDSLSDLLHILHQRCCNNSSPPKDTSSLTSLPPIFFSNFNPSESRPEVRYTCQLTCFHTSNAPTTVGLLN